VSSISLIIVSLLHKKVAVLSAGESFGLKEIAEELEFRETSVVCSSVNAEVLLLEKKVYF